MKTIYIAIGDEIADGRILDTNSRVVTEALGPLASRYWNLQVPDSLVAIQAALHGAVSQQAELIVVSGGLGPTRDDLTREAVAAVAGVELDWSEDAWENVTSAFSSRGINEIPPANRQQALLPKGASLLRNKLGTAPGFALTLEQGAHARTAFVACLPGVPYEFEAMLRDELMPLLRSQRPESNAVRAAETVDQFLFAGIGESAFESSLQNLVPSQCISSYAICAREGLLELKIGWSSPTNREEYFPLLRKIIAPFLLSHSLDPLSVQIERLLSACKQKVAIVESGTAGMLAMQLALSSHAQVDNDANAEKNLFGHLIGASLLGSTQEWEISQPTLLQGKDSVARGSWAIQACESIAHRLVEFAAADFILLNLSQHPARLQEQTGSTESHSIILSRRPPTHMAEWELQKVFKRPMIGVALEAVSSKILQQQGYCSLITWSHSIRIGPATPSIQPTLSLEICRRMTNGSLAGMLQYLQRGKNP